MNVSKIINVLLFISAINLTLMVPGGFIESRDFSHISPIILGVFNVFLTSLGMVSLFLIYFIHRKRTWAVIAAFVCGLGYFAVYVLDLAKIFPKSPTPMPASLFIMETLGTLLSIPLMYFTLRDYKRLPLSKGPEVRNNYLYWLIGLAILVGMAIIIFATKAAMSEQ